MTGIRGASAYQQINKAFKASKINTGPSDERPEVKTGQKGPANEDRALNNETKPWTPIDKDSLLVPQKTEYGNTIGSVKLSDKAKDYYDQLRSKFHNMEFIAVSSDMKAQVQKNAASYGNANKMVVLIDEEKLERMAEDESFRKKYEGIISMSQNRLTEAKNSLASSGASIKNFGMSVDKDGKESFFATLDAGADKLLEAGKKRIEKKAAEKKEKKAKEKKKAEKEAAEERLKEKRAKTEKNKKTEKSGEEDELPEEKDYITFKADSLEKLISKVQAYTYKNKDARILTDEERMMGTNIDIRG